MRILCLFKRRYMRKDVIVDRYARLYELPRQLALRGHEVLGLCLNYRGRAAAFTSVDAQGAGRLRWQSCDLGATLLPGLLDYRRLVHEAIAAFRPDILLGGSDSLHVAMTAHFARAARLPYALDLFDNYESFGLARLPGLTRAYHHALRHADAVTCVSEPLRAMIAARHAPPERVSTLESTINHELFHPRDRAASRARLGLPANARLVGTAGALDASRGIATLYRAYERLSAAHPDLHLVLAGPRAGATPLPDAPRVIHLGELPHERIPELFSALDVAVICMRDTAFGRYAFPQKAYEIIACRTPVVAARVGALATLLSGQAHSLYEVDDIDSLQRCLAAQLAAPSPCDMPVPDWAAQAAHLEAVLEQACAGAPARQRILAHVD
ncbi:MAG: glycosyltransferase family 4 protein [Proteobacteria bacterium]|nr:glycosyltransferase family 4 protein [Pseudomonadota bacterium]MBK8957104.1 glycosyltransferase family 4 protein [Pseudomonadota bacterium]